MRKITLQLGPSQADPRESRRAKNRTVAHIRMEYERVVELCKKRTEPDLHFGEMGIDLTGRSVSDVRREAKRWARICKRPALATREDLEMIEGAGCVRKLAKEWSSAASGYDAFVAKANQDAEWTNK